MVRILINGICGVMGRVIMETAAASDGRYSVVAGIDIVKPEQFPVPVYTNGAEVREEYDVLVDFSVAKALPGALNTALSAGKPIVVGTTALTEEHKSLLQEASSKIPVFQSHNMSLGINLLCSLVRTAKKTLGDDYDVEIVERHHRKKLDAPSGTALMLADCIKEESRPDTTYVLGRHETAKRRTDEEIGINAVRGGTVVGEHEVLFLGSDEVIELNHRAYSKKLFATGALRAAAFVAQKSPGFYNMNDVIEADLAK